MLPVHAPDMAGQPRLAHLHNGEQFQAVMNAGVVATSTHFALHHLTLADVPHRSQSGLTLFPPALVWMGALLPKRHAKKAVRRNMLRRQIYSLGQALCSQLAGGALVIRLRRGFDNDGFVSASSRALKKVVRAELSDLLRRAVDKLAHKAQPPSPL